jgi:hypothetical protein
MHALGFKLTFGGAEIIGQALFGTKFSSLHFLINDPKFWRDVFKLHANPF